MAYEPIERLEISNYGCIRDAIFNLTPLHALIGPNDSGKSTALRALGTLAQFGAGDIPVVHPGSRSIDSLLEQGRGSRLQVSFPDGLGYEIKATIGAFEESARSTEGSLSVFQGRAWREDGVVTRGWDPKVGELRERLAAATIVRLDPDYLRAPANLIPEDRKIAFADERGTGLSSVFDALINRDTLAFTRIQEDVQRLFPSVARLGLSNVSDSKKKLAVTLGDGTRVGAEAMSEGLLYYLGFAALKHVSGSRLFLVEEPENGLHPSRIVEIVRILREIARSSQVIIATHSPFVVNELEGHEVSVVTRDPQIGTKAVLLRDVPKFEDASKVYMPGEFWVSYADGNLEEPLLNGTPRS